MKDALIVIALLVFVAALAFAKLGMQFSNGTGIVYHLINRGFDRSAQIGLVLTVLIGVGSYLYKKGRKGD
ncbi:amino acid transporter [Lysobacter sp. OAE881]|uniref:hypothetical protein n=1 Tax=Lysobacter sp. OAE881 TaxID=2663813 RepID=UPI00178965EF